MQKLKMKIPILNRTSLVCPTCKTRKIEVEAGAIEEPCELPAKCKCGERFTINFALL